MEELPSILHRGMKQPYSYALFVRFSMLIAVTARDNTTLASHQNHPLRMETSSFFLHSFRPMRVTDRRCVPNMTSYGHIALCLKVLVDISFVPSAVLGCSADLSAFSITHTS